MEPVSEQKSAQAMSEEQGQFSFERARGVVWVCDLVGSSRYLNDDETASQLEAFLPRFYWIANTLVEVAGGQFIKWTGDGFIAWFNVELHRELGKRADVVLHAADFLTALVKLTGLEVDTEKSFTLHHGVTYEKDALLIHIPHPGGYVSLDIIGRAVVLACRLTSVPSELPFIVTQRDIVEVVSQKGQFSTRFTAWKPTAEDLLRYFKNERLGTSTLYASREYHPPPSTIPAPCLGKDPLRCSQT